MIVEIQARPRASFRVKRLADPTAFPAKLTLAPIVIAAGCSDASVASPSTRPPPSRVMGF
jgi:hypothetical protein